MKSTVFTIIFVTFLVHIVAGYEESGFTCSHEFTKTQGKNSQIQIYKMHVKSLVRNRYARTTVTSKVKNCGDTPNEAVFSLVIPETAFISHFVMEVDGKNYTAYVEEKDQAKKTYQKAVSHGLGAGHVAVSVRDSNRITVTVNVQSESKAAFHLTYEELLIRQKERYELVINLHPGQRIQDLIVEVLINESRKITYLETPSIRTGSNLIEENNLNTGAYKKIINKTSAVVAFTPSCQRQEEFAKMFNNKEGDGLSGQFIVQYDVARDPKGGQVLIQDGYFVHFFAPSDLPRLPKHVVFVLDTSSSMITRKKIDQLKEAMYQILDELNPDDVFHLVEFNTDVRIWILSDSPYSVRYSVDNMEKIMKDFDKHKSYAANYNNIQKAKLAVSKFEAQDLTNVYSSLRIGLYLIQVTKILNMETVNHQPMIIFLTDGDPTAGVTSRPQILKDITKFNTGLRKTPIFALSFGDDADRDFLEKLSISNAGFPKHIYEASDATLQLHNFYNQISSPILANVVFRYESTVENLTNTEFAFHFQGAELVTAGRYEDESMDDTVIQAWNGETDLTFEPVIQQSFSSIERLWAYLTVKQLLEKKDLSAKDEEDRRRKAIDLSLKYSFVTPVTSLVVVKPNVTSTAEPEVAIESAAGADGYNPDLVSRGPVIQKPIDQQYSLSTNLLAMDVDRIYKPDFDVFLNARFGPSDDEEVQTEEIQPLFHNSSRLVELLSSTRMLWIPTGKYKLGEAEIISETFSCSNSILNSDGHCRLLHSCVADPLSMRYDDYIEHFCLLKNEYAGICCPDAWYSE